MTYGNMDSTEFPRVSVVIPCFNNEEYISQSISSVLTQNYPNLEVIVIDDGSTDNSLSVIKSFENRIIWRTGLNKGAPSARNDGLLIATGDFVMFLDGDDFIEGNLLGGLVRAMTQGTSDIGFAPCQHLFPDKSRNKKTVPSFISSDDVVFKWLAYSQGVNSCSVLWRVSFIRDIGGWDKSIGRNQDGEVALRAILMGARFAISSDGSGIYRIQPPGTSISGRAGNLGSLFDVAEKLAAIPSKVITQERFTEATSLYFYHVARRCYSSRNIALGDKALRLSRQLGYRGHMGSVVRRGMYRVLGVKNIYAATHLAKSLRHSVAGLFSSTRRS